MKIASKLLLLLLLVGTLLHADPPDLTKASTFAQSLYKLYRDGRMPLIWITQPDPNYFGVTLGEYNQAIEEIRKADPEFNHKYLAGLPFRKYFKASPPYSEDPLTYLRGYHRAYHQLTKIAGEDIFGGFGLPKTTDLDLKFLEYLTKHPSSTLRLYEANLISQEDRAALGNPTLKELDRVIERLNYFDPNTQKITSALTHWHSSNHNSISYSEQERIEATLKELGYREDDILRLNWVTHIKDKGTNPRKLNWRELSPTAKSLHALFLDKVQNIKNGNPVTLTNAEIELFREAGTTELGTTILSAMTELEFYDPDLTKKMKESSLIAEKAANELAKRMATRSNAEGEPLNRVMAVIQNAIDQTSRKKPVGPTKAEIEAGVARAMEAEKARIGSSNQPSDPRVRKAAATARNELENPAYFYRRQKTDPEIEPLFEAMTSGVDQARLDEARLLLKRLLELNKTLVTNQGTAVTLGNLPNLTLQLKASENWPYEPEILIVREGADPELIQLEEKRKGKVERFNPVSVGVNIRTLDKEGVAWALVKQNQENLETLNSLLVKLTFIREDPNPHGNTKTTSDIIDELKSWAEKGHNPGKFIYESQISQTLGARAADIMWAGFSENFDEPIFWNQRKPSLARRMLSPSLRQSLGISQEHQPGFWNRLIKNAGVTTGLVLGAAAADRYVLTEHPIQHALSQLSSELNRIREAPLDIPGSPSQAMDPFQDNERPLFTIEGQPTEKHVIELSSPENVKKDELIKYKSEGLSNSSVLKSEVTVRAKNGILPIATLRGKKTTGVKVFDANNNRLIQDIDFELKENSFGRLFAVFKDERNSKSFRYEVYTRDSTNSVPDDIPLRDSRALEHVAAIAEKKHLPELAARIRTLIAHAKSENRPVYVSDIEKLAIDSSRYSYAHAPVAAWLDKDWNTPLGGLHHYINNAKFDIECWQAGKMVHDMLFLYNEKAKDPLEVEHITVLNETVAGKFRNNDLHAQVGVKPPGKPPSTALILDGTPNEKDPLNPKPKSKLVHPASAPPQRNRKTPPGVTPMPKQETTSAVHDNATPRPDNSSPLNFPKLPLPEGSEFLAEGFAFASRKRKPVIPKPIQTIELRYPPENPDGKSLPSIVVSPENEATYHTPEEQETWLTSLESVLSALRNDRNYQLEILGIRNSNQMVGSQISELGHAMAEYHKGRIAILPQNWTPGEMIPINGTVEYKTGILNYSLLGIIKEIDPKLARTLKTEEDVKRALPLVTGKLKERLSEVIKRSGENRSQFPEFLHYLNSNYTNMLRNVVSQLENPAWRNPTVRESLTCIDATTKMAK